MFFLYPKVISKLHQALQQRFQLAIQQSYSIGIFLSECIRVHNRIQQEQGNELEQTRSRGRPKRSSLLEKLDDIEELAVSSSCLQDHVTISQTVSNFPLLAFVNEPMSHLASADVRHVTSFLPDKIHHDCHVPVNVSDAHQRLSPFESFISDDGESPKLSAPIPYHTVCTNDGDGLILNIDIDSPDPLKERHVKYVRLNSIDAPERGSIHFVKTDDLSNVYCKRMGHLSLCGIHFFVKLFAYTGTSDLCEEITKDGYSEPFDVYDRPLKEFWFRFSSSPNNAEERLIRHLDSLVGIQSRARRRLMSPFPVSEATNSKPFMLSLNALLVVTGFCHVFTRFCQDNLLLELQEVAKNNQLGPIWCGPSRNFIFECTSANNDDLVLKKFNERTTTQLPNRGYPIQNLQHRDSKPLLPWHERQMEKTLCSSQTTRSQALENNSKPLVGKQPQFCMHFDITR